MKSVWVVSNEIYRVMRSSCPRESAMSAVVREKKSGRESHAMSVMFCLASALELAAVPGERDELMTALDALADRVDQWMIDLDMEQEDGAGEEE